MRVNLFIAACLLVACWPTAAGAQDGPGVTDPAEPSAGGPQERTTGDADPARPGSGSLDGEPVPVTEDTGPGMTTGKRTEADFAAEVAETHSFWERFRRFTDDHLLRRFQQLAGEVRRVAGLDRRLAEAARLGFTHALVPPDAGTPPPTMKVTEVRDLGAVLSAIR